MASDAEADPRHAFGSLTEALRQIYIDENISVDLNLDHLRLDPATGRTKAHHTVGIIRYPCVVDPDTGAQVRPAEIGFLVVLKSSIIGDESVPILNYRQDNPEFPHQTTGDQFFDDDQFESYRALGSSPPTSPSAKCRTPRGSPRAERCGRAPGAIDPDGKIGAMSALRRRKSVVVDVGGVQVGSAHPVVVQSMTNTDTADVAGDGRPGAGARTRRAASWSGSP